MKIDLIKSGEKYFIITDSGWKTQIFNKSGDLDKDYRLKAIKEFDNYIKIHKEILRRNSPKIIKTTTI